MSDAFALHPTTPVGFVPGRSARLGPRVRVMLAVAFYIAIYVWMYLVFVEPRWNYYGLGLREDLSGMEALLLCFVAWLPSALLPQRLRKPSDFLVGIQYLLVYVPCVWTSLNASLPTLERGRAWSLVLVLLVAMTLQLAVNRYVRVGRLPMRPMGRPLFAWVAGGVLAISMLVLAVNLGGQFQLVTLDKIYELRTEAAEALAQTQSTLTVYLFNWASGAFLPCLLALGLVRSSKLLVGSAAVAYVFLYGVWGSKAVLFAPVICVGLWWLIRDPSRVLLVTLVKTFCVLLLTPLLSVALNPDLREFIEGWVLQLIHQRTFSSSALLIPQYLDFFSQQPYTLGSHINALRPFITYPFDTGVPTTVGIYYYGGPVTANVNYWAQDGIAAFGLAGIVPVAALAALVFWLLDCAAEGLDPRFTTTCVAFAAMNLVDTSLFTSLLTGGLALLILTLVLVPRSWAPPLHTLPRKP